MNSGTTVEIRKVVMVGVACVFLIPGRSAGYFPDPPPPPPPEPCATSWCEVVKGPSGGMTITNIVIWPEPVTCLGSYIVGWMEAETRCSEVITRTVWSPPSTNCPPHYYTNISCPEIITNWWVIDFPGYSGSGPWSYGGFLPTNCGEGTFTFYITWKEKDPCTGQLIGGGTASKTANFKVVNTDISETEKFTCVCETVSYTLTNTCDPVTWEVWTNGVPGEPTVSGSSIVAGTNCGSWLVTARANPNTNCTDWTMLTVVKVESLTPSEGTWLDDGDNNSDTDTYLVACCPSNFITVTASPCPGLEDTNLPSCWQMSGGLQYTNQDGTTSRTKRRVDLGTVGSVTISAVAGCSSKTVKIIVYRAKFKIFAAWGNCAEEYGHAWWELSVEPQDVYAFLKKADGTELSNILGTGGYYGDGSVSCVTIGCQAEVRQPDNGQEPNVAYWWCVSFGELVNALTYVYDLKKYPGTYHLFNNNCVHKAVAVGAQAGVYIGYSGYTPCGLAQYLVGLPAPTCECQ